MSEEQEQCQAQRKERNELGMRRGHPIAFPMHLLWSLLLQYPLQNKIQSLTCHLPSKHRKDLDFASRPDQTRVDHAEALGNERQVCAEIGNWIIGVLDH